MRTRVTRPRTDRDRALRRRRDHARAVESLKEANDQARIRAESVVVEMIYYEEVFKAHPELRPTLEEQREDMEAAMAEADREKVIPIEVGQVWSRGDELLRVLEIKTDTGGDGGHFLVKLRDAKRSNARPFMIDAAWLRMDYELEKGAAAPGQMELF